jgi:hypothetical protein
MRGRIRWRRCAAIALSLCCCFLSVACADNSTAGIHKVAPPSFFDWNYNASVGAATPQEAYARSAHFAPCRMTNDDMRPATDQSVTWLVSGPRVGVAYLRATCRNAFHGNYVYRSFLVLFKGGQDTWYIDHFQRQVPFPPTEDPTPTLAPLPPSVADLFPADRYIDWGPWQLNPPDTPVSWAGRAWFSLTPRDYVLGLLKESATRPPEATVTTVGGLPGWVMEANEMATVVAPRPDGSVVVVSGTGSASAIEALATHALPRADDALRDRDQSAITATPGA